MISTLVITIIIEALIALLYCVWQKKPIHSILVTSIAANVITQLLLWVALINFFQYYLVVLLVAEILIWFVESLALYYIPTNRLRFAEAVILSLGMNFISFALGWFLPV